MFANLFRVSLLVVATLPAWANTHVSLHHNRHVEIAKRQAGPVQLYKRFDSARWTFYDVGQGACGKVNVADDFIVALNSAQYGGGYPGPNCFKSITMTYNGKTARATIMDECPGCPYGGLDLSRGLFKFFAPESVGVLYGTWYFNDGSDNADSTPKTTSSKYVYVAPKTTSSKKHTTTSYKPEPTTYWTPEPTATSSKKSSTHLSSSPPSSSKVSSSASSKHSPTSTFTSTSASTTPSTAPSSSHGTQNLYALNQSFLQLGSLVVAAT